MPISKKMPSASAEGQEVMMFGGVHRVEYITSYAHDLLLAVDVSPVRQPISLTNKPSLRL